LRANLTKKDVVLIKGSRGLQMDRITASLEVRS
jgi:UDP-N-acetylmuramyl pentapeptide synthase